MNKLICPYCKEEVNLLFEPIHSQGPTTRTCSHCGEKFMYIVKVIREYHSFPVYEMK